MAYRILIIITLIISYSQLSILAQNQYEELLMTSQIVVVGRVEKTLSVIDSKKMNEASEDLQKVEEAVLGRLTFFKVEEIVWAEKTIKIERTVLIYVPKGNWTDSSLPRFKNNGRYLLFLSVQQKETILENAVISDTKGKKNIFDYEFQPVFKLTKNKFGLVPLTESNEEILINLRESTSSRFSQKQIEAFPLLMASLGKSEFSGGESIDLVFTIKNETNYAIILFDTVPERSFEISVMDDEGKELPLSEIGRKRKDPDIVMAREMVYLVPGKELTWQLDLRRLFEINKAGNYSVKVERKYFLKEDIENNPKSNVISSKPIKFRVVK